MFSSCASTTKYAATAAVNKTTPSARLVYFNLVFARAFITKIRDPVSLENPPFCFILKPIQRAPQFKKLTTIDDIDITYTQ